MTIPLRVNLTLARVRALIRGATAGYGAINVPWTLVQLIHTSGNTINLVCEEIVMIRSNAVDSQQSITMAGSLTAGITTWAVNMTAAGLINAISVAQGQDNLQ
jgi:hydroxymethylglutaryl-CoA reductase